MFKIISGNDNKKKAPFSFGKTEKKQNASPKKDSRVWQNIEILSEILKGDLNNLLQSAA
tara:strand:+ start:561 stop:737 length:177 start_codon:yes stop_codon:yes gene_type:complete